MRYADVMSIETPEGIHLELELAGLGSRFVAALADSLIRTAIVLSVVFLVLFTNDGVVAAVGVLAVLFALLGYDILFEVSMSGRTPGKRWTGIRVVTTEGAPVDFRTSAVRNLLRLVDFLPSFYAVGIVTILATRHNQRLGDLAAGTVVVREKVVSLPATDLSRARDSERVDVPAWDISALTAEEVAAVRRYLERRVSLAPAARATIADELTRRLHPKIVGPPPTVAADEFLEELLAAATSRGR